MTRNVKPSAPMLLCLSALVAAAALGGCRDKPTFDELTSAIERQLPGTHFEQTAAVHLGGMSLGFLRGAARLASVSDENDAAREALLQIHGIDLATYEVSGLEAGAGLRLPPDLEESLRREGWTTMVHAAEAEEQTWILYRDDGSGVVRGLYVVSLDRGDDELVLIRLDGRLDKILAAALAAHPHALVHEVRSEG